MRRSTRASAKPATIAAVAVVAVVAVGIGAGPGRAQEPKPAPGRYVMQPTDGGALRLDTETGAVSLCARKAEQWSCDAIGDAARSGRDDLERLKRENTDLRATVKHLEDMLGLGPDKDGGQKRAEGPGISLPTEQQIDGAIDYIERMYKKLRDKMKQLESTAPAEKGTPL